MPSIDYNAFDDGVHIHIDCISSVEAGKKVFAGFLSDPTEAPTLLRNAALEDDSL